MQMRRINYHGEIIVISFILFASIIFAAAIGVRGYGDGNTYYAMVSSLIKDGDLILDNRDIRRWQYDRFQNMPVGVNVLIDGKGVIRYNKPILYPLVAAPFFLFLGRRGFAFLNGLFLGGGIVFCYLFLRRYFNKSYSLLITTMFFFGSFILVYVAWIHPEMLLFFTCALCMWLWLNKNKTVLSALVIGIAGSVKIIFLLLFIPLIMVLVSEKKFKKLSRAIGICFLGIGFISVLTILLLGQISAYSGVNGLITSRLVPYLTTGEIKKALAIIPTHLIGIGFNSWDLFFRNILYFFLGRFTGIIWYAFPALICAGIHLLHRRYLIREEKILGDSILFVTLLLAVILVIARPLNYFGGQDFICNRYFFILPALFFLPAIKKVKKPKIIVLAFLPGLLISYQIIKNFFFFEHWHSRYGKATYTFAQSAHTGTFPLKYAPLEILQVESFFIHQVKVSENISLYAPSGLLKQIGQKILIDVGQEVVMVNKNSINYLKLETNHGKITLRPWAVLEDRINRERRSFYYFKADLPTWVNNVS